MATRAGTSYENATDVVLLAFGSGASPTGHELPGASIVDIGFEVAAAPVVVTPAIPPVASIPVGSPGGIGLPMIGV